MESRERLNLPAMINRPTTMTLAQMTVGGQPAAVIEPPGGRVVDRSFNATVFRHHLYGQLNFSLPAGSPRRARWHWPIRRARKLENLFPRYAQAVATIDRWPQETANLMEALLQANCRGLPPGRGSTASAAHFRDPLTIAKPSLPRFDIKAAATRTVGELEAEMGTALVGAVDKFSADLENLLSEAVRQELVGRIAWCQRPDSKATDLVRYCYYQRDLRVNIRNRITPVGRDRVRDETSVVRRGTIELHVHDLVRARCLPVHNSLPKPQRVVELIERIPKFLAPFVQVVDGHQFHDAVGEATEWQQIDVRVQERNLYRYEPAVVLGQYVLTGWLPEEVERENDGRGRARLRGEVSGFALPWPRCLLGMAAAAAIVAGACVVDAAVKAGGRKALAAPARPVLFKDLPPSFSK